MHGRGRCWSLLAVTLWDDFSAVTGARADGRCWCAVEGQHFQVSWELVDHGIKYKGGVRVR